LSEISAVTWLDDELFKYLIEGYKFIYQIIASEAPDWLSQSVEVTIPALSYSTAIPPDSTYIYFVMDENGMKLTKLPLDQCFSIIKTSSPSKALYWARQGKNLVVAPVPGVDQKLYIFYIPAPPNVSSLGDEVPLDEIFHPFIVEYAVIRAHNRNERPTLVEQNFLSLRLETIRSILGAEGSLRNIDTSINWNPI